MKIPLPFTGFANICRSLLPVLLLIAIASHIASAAPGSQTPAPVAKGYDAFRLVRTMNIFDPERRPIRSDTSAEAPIASVNQNGRPAFVALTGTMVTEGRSLAFFTGSQSDFNKVLPLHEKIAAYTITGIASTHVDLERDGKPIVLVVGKQLSISGSVISQFQPDSSASDTPTSETASPLSSSASDASATAASPSGRGTPPPANPSAGSSPAVDKEEVMRRMIERRNKELSK